MSIARREFVAEAVAVGLLGPAAPLLAKGSPMHGDHVPTTTLGGHGLARTG